MLLQVCTKLVKLLQDLMAVRIKSARLVPILQMTVVLALMDISLEQEFARRLVQNLVGPEFRNPTSPKGRGVLTRIHYEYNACLVSEYFIHPIDWRKL